MEVLAHIGRESVWGGTVEGVLYHRETGQDADAEVGRLEEQGERRKVEEKGGEKVWGGERKVGSKVRKKGGGEEKR